MRKPRHSIIVPAYNTGESIRQCIESIIAQSSSDWELIIIDDGSLDSTLSIINEYSQKDRRIKAFHISNGGVSNARNVGIEKAVGEYIMFVDSDDWIEADYLKQVEAKMQDDADIYILGISLDYTASDGFVEYSEIKGSPTYTNISVSSLYDKIGYLIKTMNMESSCLKSYRRSFLEQNGIRFDTNMFIFEDFHFVLNCLLKKPSVTLIPFIGYHYVVDLEYNPVARRGQRDLYPSVHELFNILDKLSKRLDQESFSNEVVLRTMAEKIQVVTSQSSAKKSMAAKKRPFKQLNNDSVLKKRYSKIMQYVGGRLRLQLRLASYGFPTLAYIAYKVLK